MLVVAAATKGEDDDLLEWPRDFSCDILCASNRNLWANSGHDFEYARADRQIDRCGWLSSSSLLHGYWKSNCGDRGRGVLFRLGARSTRSRKIYSGVLV